MQVLFAEKKLFQIETTSLMMLIEVRRLDVVHHIVLNATCLRFAPILFCPTKSNEDKEQNESTTSLLTIFSSTENSYPSLFIFTASY